MDSNDLAVFATSLVLVATTACATTACGSRQERERMAAKQPQPEVMMAAAGKAPTMPTETAVFAMGCFWGAEEHFVSLPGVVATSVGYSGGAATNPSYEEVCTGSTGHAEVVQVVYDPQRIGYDALLQVFWEQHDPTQGNRQGNDVGTQYRSAIYTHGEAQQRAALASRDAYAAALKKAGKGAITTEIRPAPVFYAADAYHQKYCVRNPEGYCGHGGTGVAFPQPMARN